MFGDIVSDLCAGLVGGLGFAPSANLGDDYAVFEPTHGSAPKYAGQYKVNPIAMLLTVKLMFDWLKENEMAARLESAIARVIAEGKVRTYDLGGKDSTLDVAKGNRRVCRLIRPIVKLPNGDRADLGTKLSDLDLLTRNIDMVVTRRAFLNHRSESRDKTSSFSRMRYARQPLIQRM